MQQPTSNFEGKYSVYFYKKKERSDSILRHSLFDILLSLDQVCSVIRFSLPLNPEG
ncbi:hypothetical protein D1BOALGB6SA_836 [Olavius sp. associated proteobacterium Delta 1]|nr:hypothetical protein D1BOALGB6SA_836 [Olavius sp. associated proteobacterium Delta 1]